MNQDLGNSRVGFFLYSPSDRKVLIHKRDDKTEHSPNKWDYFGGAIEQGETVEEALTREIYEELGIWIDKDGLELLSQENNIYYIVFPKYIRTLRLGEGAGFAWFSTEEALGFNEDLMTEDARRYLKLLRERFSA